MTTSWPYGKPSATQNYGGDRQHHEETALALWQTAESKLTPTGRLRKRVDPADFKSLVDRAVAAMKTLIERYPDKSDNYRRWLAETEVMAAKVK